LSETHSEKFPEKVMEVARDRDRPDVFFLKRVMESCPASYCGVSRI
jgi:hypothetical protein